jgi:hypothetical protein
LPCASCSIAPCATSGTDSMTTTTTSPASPN